MGLPIGIVIHAQMTILLPCTHTHTHLLVNSFTEVAKFLLKIPGVKFLLSERFCQDPLEAFFGNQRAKGGRNDNPNVEQFCNSTVSLRVQGSAALAPIRGNCKRQTSTITVDETPLPKRARHSKK